MNNTLLLDTMTWDLTIDNAANIGMARPPYALAQDAASSIRTFSGEVYYDTSRGLPYFQQILGHAPPISLMKALFAENALLVPGVVKAQSFITRWEKRQVNGQVQIQDEAGNTSVAGF